MVQTRGWLSGSVSVVLASVKAQALKKCVNVNEARKNKSESLGHPPNDGFANVAFQTQASNLKTNRETNGGFPFSPRCWGPLGEKKTPAFLPEASHQLIPAQVPVAVPVHLGEDLVKLP